MDEVLSLLRQTHVAAGCIGLAAFWIPIVAKKGATAHKLAGRVFAFCAVYVGTTGLGLSIWACAHPPSFFGDPELRQIPPERVPIAMAETRFLYTLTGFLALSILAAVVLGIRVVRTRRTPHRLASPALMTLLGAYGLWSLGLVAFGAWSMLAIRSGEHALPSTGGGRYWVTIAVGGIGVWGAWSDLRHVRGARQSRSPWLPKHMECMLGAGIGFHAAAFFFGANELLGLDLRGAMRFAPMIVPFAVGVPAMWWVIARWERKHAPADGAGT